MAIGCKRCGRCCEFAEIWLDPTMDIKNAEFAMKRLGAVLLWRDGEGLKIMAGRCPYLAKDGSACLIYETRPEICREKSEDPNQVVPGCRYYDESENI